jgi:hypothetical protein
MRSASIPSAGQNSIQKLHGGTKPDKNEVCSTRIFHKQHLRNVYAYGFCCILLEYGPERHFEAGAGTKAI